MHTQLCCSPITFIEFLLALRINLSPVHIPGPDREAHIDWVVRERALIQSRCEQVGELKHAADWFNLISLSPDTSIHLDIQRERDSMQICMCSLESRVLPRRGAPRRTRDEWVTHIYFHEFMAGYLIISAVFIDNVMCLSALNNGGIGTQGCLMLTLPALCAIKHTRALCTAGRKDLQ